MADKKPVGKKSPPPARDPRALQILEKDGKTREQLKSRVALEASLNSAVLVDAFNGNIMGKDLDLQELVSGLKETFQAIKAGDLSSMEEMLAAQAIALQTMFTNLSRRAVTQEYLKQYQSFMGLALKAQAQSRATISALVDLKYPKQGATFVRQANISGGHQQVNNGAIPDPSAHARQNSTEQTKLLDRSSHGQRLDMGAQTETGGINPGLGTVEEVHRA